MHTNRAYAESSTAAHLNVCHMKIANPGKTNRISHKDKLKEKNRKKERRQRIKGNVGKFLKKKTSTLIVGSGFFTNHVTRK